jgi:hypothetical protein
LKEARDQLQAKCEHLERALDLLCSHMGEWFGDCPGEQELVELTWCETRVCTDDYASCWKQYALEQTKQQPKSDQEVR